MFASSLCIHQAHTPREAFDNSINNSTDDDTDVLGSSRDSEIPFRMVMAVL